jgi:hypothetical protein
MKEQSVNLDYCGIVILLRQIVQCGYCTHREAQRIAARIAAQSGVDIIFSL